ncbi:MAG: patatin-like phospholipase family protein [Deltaproteobacteria bacterium]|nr:patatin-like phospholipase family protein [Deltaproteobacteria bacterium]
MAIDLGIHMPKPSCLGLVLSGGGVRAVYQAGFLKALAHYLKTNPIKIITASSVGSINGYILALTLNKISFEECTDLLLNLWLERTFDNTFDSIGSLAFLRGLIFAAILHRKRTVIIPKKSILNPGPLLHLLDDLTDKFNSLRVSEEGLCAFGIMTTLVEEKLKKGVLFVQATERIKASVKKTGLYEIVYRSILTPRHCLASAALPTVLPPVLLDIEKNSGFFVDGGFVQNVPIDPAVRLGANEVLVIDVSGRTFWKNALNLPKDAKPSWELSNAEADGCLAPKRLLKEETLFPFGKILKEIIGSKKMRELGPIYPMFKIFERALGEDLAFEAASYVTLNPEFVREVAKLGFQRGLEMIPHMLNYSDPPSRATG